MMRFITGKDRGLYMALWNMPCHGVVFPRQSITKMFCISCMSYSLITNQFLGL